MTVEQFKKATAFTDLKAKATKEELRTHLEAVKNFCNRKCESCMLGDNSICMLMEYVPKDWDIEGMLEESECKES